MLKDFVKQALPPYLLNLLKDSGILGLNIHWSGDYKGWASALRDSSGYDSDIIIEKVLAAQLKVRNGEAAFERDSVLFEEPDYEWPLLSALMWIAARDHRLNVLDFGGSLGSTYFQHQTFLQPLPNVIWNIVEQRKFVEYGRQHFQNDQLRFFETTDECLKDNDVNVILLASVLPYLEKPYDFLDLFMRTPARHIVIDRTPFTDSPDDRLTVQHVPASIYKASYPAWFFSEKKFRRFIEKDFQIVAEFQRNDRFNIPSVVKGFLLERKNGISQPTF